MLGLAVSHCSAAVEGLPDANPACCFALCRYYQSLDKGHQENIQEHLVTFLAEAQCHEKTRSIWVGWMHKVSRRSSSLAAAGPFLPDQSCIWSHFVCVLPSPSCTGKKILGVGYLYFISCSIFRPFQAAKLGHCSRILTSLGLCRCMSGSRVMFKNSWLLSLYCLQVDPKLGKDVEQKLQEMLSK